MMPLRIDVDRDEIARIAQSRGVSRLPVFGSVLFDEFDPGRSDVDLLADLADNPGDRFDAYFGLKEDLERVFDRAVDLVIADAVRNPYSQARTPRRARSRRQRSGSPPPSGRPQRDGIRPPCACLR